MGGNCSGIGYLQTSIADSENLSPKCVVCTQSHKHYIVRFLPGCMTNQLAFKALETVNIRSLESFSDFPTIPKHHIVEKREGQRKARVPTVQGAFQKKISPDTSRRVKG